MNVNIAPVASVQAVSATVPAAPRTHIPVSAQRVTASEDAVSVDTMPASPPPEVHEAIGVAAQSYERLQASGHELGFAIDPTTRKVVTEVRDTQGNLLWTAPASKALEVAAGAPLDQTH
jgi:predicted phage gp36 major capsid-like protein